MDQRPTKQEQKRELSARLAASRVRIDAGRTSVLEKLNPVRRLRNTVRRKPVKTFAVAAGVAFVIGLLRRRPNRRKHKRGLGALALAGAFRLAQPALRFWVLKLVKDRLIHPHTAKLPPIPPHSS